MHLKKYIDQYQKILFKQISPQSIGIFRIILGVVLFFECQRLLQSMQIYYVNVDMHFYWQLLKNVPTLSLTQYQTIVYAMYGLSVMVVLGLWSRIAIFFYLSGYVYFLVLDASYYNNHYYFLALLMFIYIVIGTGDNWASIRFKWNKKHNATIPYWNLFLLKTQVFLVYLIAAIVKLNVDWLSTNTMRAVYKYSSDYKSFKTWMNEDFFAYFFTFTGILFDFFVSILLWVPGVRLFLIPFILIFHGINTTALQIGIFPYLMASATLLYFRPDFPAQMYQKARELLGKNVLPHSNVSPLETATGRKKNKLIVFGVTTYIMLQALLPFRHFLIPGTVDWSGEANNFAWRMKIGLKYIPKFEVYVYNKNTGKEYKPDLFINTHQYQILALNPVRTLQVADHVASLIDLPRDSLDIFVKFEVFMNDHPPSKIIDDKVNMLSAKFNPIGHSEFISLRPEKYEYDQRYWMKGFKWLYPNKFER